MRLALILENPQRLAYIQRMFTAKGIDPNRAIRASEHLLAADPTPQKNLAQWLAKLALNKIIAISGIIGVTPASQVRLPEDGARISEVLAQFVRAKPRLPQDQRDINRFRDFHTLETALQTATDAGTVKGGALARRMPGAEIIYDQPPYTLYLIPKITKLPKIERRRGSDPVDQRRPPEELQRIETVQELGMGPPETRWCTRAGYGDEYAERYLQSADIYILYRDGMPFIQSCGKQCMDVNDRAAEFPLEITEFVRARKLQQAEQRRALMQNKIPELRARLQAEGHGGVVHVDGEVFNFDFLLHMGTYVGLFTRGQPTVSPRHHIGACWRAAAGHICEVKQGLRYPDGRVKHIYNYATRRSVRNTEPDSSTAWFIHTAYSLTRTVSVENIIEIIGITPENSTRGPIPA